MTAQIIETTAIAAEDKLTQSERDRAALYLDQTKNQITGALRNVSESQWTFKPSSGGWSIAQIVEHVIFVQELVLGPVREKLDAATAEPVHPDYKLVDDIIIYQIPNRLAKFPSPAQPAGDLSVSQALDRLGANYSQLRERIETAHGLRSRSIESLPLKAISKGAYTLMDGYQWILAAAAHTERHTKQVLEVMSDPAWPC
jgi:hypothetical protein